MTKLSLGLLVLAFTTSTAFAQDYLKCELKISDNKIDCPFFGSCPQKALKVSKSELTIEVNDGATVKGKINFKKVFLFPGTKKEKKNKVTIFKDDDRTEKLQKKVGLVTIDTKNGIDYSVSKFGNTLDINFKTSVYTLNVNLRGNAKYHDYVLTSDNAVSFKCEKLNKDVFEEIEAKKEAINAYKKAKSAASKANKQ